MKRARVSTRSEASRARACVSAVSLDALSALLAHAEAAVEQLLDCATSIACLTTDMGTRKDTSVKQACSDVAAARAAVVSATRRACFCARRRARLVNKGLGTVSELLTVTAKQLRVWGSPAVCQPCALEGVDAVYALCDVRPIVSSPVVSAVYALTAEGTSVLCNDNDNVISVVTGDGLRVVSAAGPGLKWFKPHSHNEFTVLLAQDDGSVPVWLVASDVAVDVTLHDIVGVAPSGSARSAVVGHGSVGVAYGGLPHDAAEVVLHLSVCGVRVPGTLGAGDGAWRVRVQRWPVAGNRCRALGTHVATLPVVDRHKCGLAVSADESWLVVGLASVGTLFVYSLPGGELVRTFGGFGSGPLQFNGMRQLCFAPNGNLFVVDHFNHRLQEVTLEGAFVRFIGYLWSLSGSLPLYVAAYAGVIAVGFSLGSASRVVLFNNGTGAVMSRFGEVGAAPGLLSKWCTGIQFTPDGSHVLVAESQAKRVSMFTTPGVFVRCVVFGSFCGVFKDIVVLTISGEYVLSDCDNDRVCVFSPDGMEMVRSWGVKGCSDGQFMNPTALASAGLNLYVMDHRSGRVQVFE